MSSGALAGSVGVVAVRSVMRRAARIGPRRHAVGGGCGIPARRARRREPWRRAFGLLAWP